MKDRFLVVSVLLGLALPAVPASAQNPRPFVAISPCRLADTRDSSFPAGYGPPALSSGVVRVITFSGRCGIPSGIEAVSANLTVVNTLGAGFIATFPAGSPQPDPLVSSLNYSGVDQVVANAAVIPVNTSGQANFLAGVSGTDIIIDVNGYYPSIALATEMPPVDRFTTTQIVKGAILTCASTSFSATIATCTGLQLNGLAVRLVAAEANRVCNVVTGAGFATASGSGSVADFFTWNGSNWVITTGATAPMNNLSCNR